MNVWKALPSPFFVACISGTATTLYFMSSSLAPVHIASPITVPQSVTPLELRATLPKTNREPQPLNLKDLAARPIFSETRKPIQAQKVKVEAEVVPKEKPTPIATPEEPLPTFTLSGSMTAGKKTKVLLRDQTDSMEHWVELNDTFKGWKLVKISHTSVLMARGNTKITVTQPD